MKRLITLGLKLFSIAIGAQSLSVENQLFSPHFSEQQLEVVYQLAKQYPTGGEIAIAYLDGDSVYYLGARRLPGKLVAIENRSSIFGIGSVTKVFTATLLAQAVREGRLQLTDSVSAAYDFPFAGGADFTYRQLASHTAGLPRLPDNMPNVGFVQPYAYYTPELLEQYVQENVAQGDTQQSLYSNLGFGILGYTLSHRLYGDGLANVLDERIFKPYGMQHTTLGPPADASGLVVGRNRTTGDSLSAWKFTDAMAGAGAMFSTAEDLMRFLHAHLNDADTVLALTREPIHQSESRRAVGLGWQIVQPEPGRTIHWHNGGTASYRSFAGMDVDRRRAIVVLTNAMLAGPEVDRAGMQFLR